MEAQPAILVKLPVLSLSHWPFKIQSVLSKSKSIIPRFLLFVFLTTLKTMCIIFSTAILPARQMTKKWSPIEEKSLSRDQNPKLTFFLHKKTTKCIYLQLIVNEILHPFCLHSIDIAPVIYTVHFRDLFVSILTLILFYSKLGYKELVGT